MDDANSILSAEVTALEAFVTDNDELLAIEENIGRFNIFDALDITRAEIRHSNFLAWLLRPSGSHGQGDLFLKPFLMDVLRQARANGMEVPISPVQLDGAELHSCDVRREWRNIDLLVVSPHLGFVIAIENKIDSGEHSNQLERYRETVASEFPDAKSLFVFLSPEGKRASDSDWLPYSYGDLHRVFRRMHDLAAGALGSDVAVFLTHYLSLIRTHMTDDTTLQKMCQTIYANHRRAIDLIIEHAEIGHAGLLKPVGEAIETDSGGPWEFFNRTGRWLRFAPQSWLEVMPPIGTGIKNKRALLVYEIYADADAYVRATIVACPCSDSGLRTKLIERLTRDPQEFGLKAKSKPGPKSQWTRLASHRSYKWDGEDEPDQELAAANTIAAFRKIRDKTTGIEQAIREVFERG